jgi:hypothetical protein
MFRKTGKKVVDGRNVFEMVEPVSCVITGKIDTLSNSSVGTRATVIAVRNDFHLVIETVFGWDDDNFGPNKYLYATTDKVEIEWPEPETFNGYSEAFAIGQAMRTYGGSFVSHLGQALQYADSENQAKIRTTWPEYWQRYLEMARKMEMFQEASK